MCRGRGEGVRDARIQAHTSNKMAGELLISRRLRAPRASSTSSQLQKTPSVQSCWQLGLHGRISPRSGRQPGSRGLRHRSQASPLPLGKRRPLLSFPSSLGKPTSKFQVSATEVPRVPQCPAPRCLAFLSMFIQDPPAMSIQDHTSVVSS